MIAWIENNLVAQPTATMGRPVAASAGHSWWSISGQLLLIMGASALLICAIVETWVGK